MSGEAKGETAVVQFWSPVETRADIVRNPRENQARSAGSSKKDGETITPTDPTIVAAEQWACLLLGFICMACGAWGICMKFSRDLSSGYVSWLGSAYEPTLRVTAVACLVSGAVLVHRGLATGHVIGLWQTESIAIGREQPRNAKRERPFDGRV